MRKNELLRFILLVSVITVMFFSMSADALTKMYAPDGRTLNIPKNEVQAYQDVGWYTEPVRVVYALDGRTMVIPKAETENYIKVGWYTEPHVTMYAADGRTLAVKTAEIALYESVGWYTEPHVTMYAADGRTLAVKTAEIALYESVGWYTEPLVTMYAVDGRTLAVKTSEIALYESVGWYTEPPVIMYAVDGRTLAVKKSEVSAYLKVGWYNSPADFPKPPAMVALTFDDGPSIFTPRILDCLAKYNAKATFFVVGSNVSSYPHVLKQAYDMGMEIGNHTMTHPNLKKLSANNISQELNQASAKISAVTKAAPRLLRPPYGNYNGTVSSLSGMPLILWSVDTLDWKTRDADKTVNCVLNEVRDGSVILMHDLYEATAEAAERIIPALIQRGYQLVTVSELASAKGYTLTNGKAYSSFK